jgi:hypothetical protein
MRFLVAALCPFDGGGPRSSVVQRASSSGSAVRGSFEFSFPSPDRRRSVWIALKTEVVVISSKAMETAALGAGPVGPLTGDFPATRGLLPIQACSGAAVDPARHRLVLVGVDIGLQKGLFVFSYFLLYLSVMLQ